MKRSVPTQPESATVRRARVSVVVANAKANGEKVPNGVGLIGFRAAAEVEKAHARSLVATARKVLTRRTVAA